MDSSDILALREHIGGILATQASPQIIITNRPTVVLNDVVQGYPMTECGIGIILNEYRGRASNHGIVGRAHVIAAMASTRRDIVRAIPSDPPLRDIALSMLGEDIRVVGTPLMTVHAYASELMGYTPLRDVYMALKGLLSVTGKTLTQQAIIGGIIYAATMGMTIKSDLDSLYTRISGFEADTSPLYTRASRIPDIVTWYVDQIDPPIIDAGFYRDALNALEEIPTVAGDYVMYPPQVDSDVYIMRPTVPIDTIDTISSTVTSMDMPTAMTTDPRKVIKVYDRVDKPLTWFSELKPGVFRIVIRVSRFPDRYLRVEYNTLRNRFKFIGLSQYIPIPTMITQMCKSLGTDTLTVPRISSTTYSFITNFVNPGIDRNILAWLVTNPPPEYASTRIQDYVFMKEDTIPNSLKEHVNVHIQLGTEKMYLTVSQQIATSGTIVNMGTSLTGFIGDQRYYRIKIIRCPSIQHAHICQGIYHHLISMYLKYYDQARMAIMTLGIDIPDNRPSILPLMEKIPSLHESYSFHDSALYRYTSSINPNILPIPTPRNEVDTYRAQGHGVLHLPTVVVNNPSIVFETEGDIWIRTPAPVRGWVLKMKSNGTYIPLMARGAPSTTIPITVNGDGTLTQHLSTSSSRSYILDSSKRMAINMDRYAYVSDSVSRFLMPVTGTDNIIRHAVSNSIIFTLNTALDTRLIARDISQYAYLCRQECYDQTVEDIERDILSLRIDPMKHHRALGRAYRMNLYFVMDDPVEPYLRKPPHAFFYLHKDANPEYPTVIMHSLPSEPDVYTLILDMGLQGIGGIRRDNYLWTTTPYLDRVMANSNRIRMVSPVDEVSEAITPTDIRTGIAGWTAKEQVIDTYGKVRAITYGRQNERITLSIGYAPVQELPIGDIREPDMVFLDDLRASRPTSVDQVRDLILRPIPDSAFDVWRRNEKSARVLRIVSYLLYSVTGEDLDEFQERIVVSGTGTYDTSLLTHSLPQFRRDTRAEEAWAYFGTILPDMIDSEEGTISVPDSQTERALYLHLMSLPKMAWPRYFPAYLRYSWDIDTHGEEKVYLSDADLLQQIIMDRSPKVRTTMVVSPIPYILSRNGFKYLVQMVKDEDHASHILWSWINEGINPGYDIIDIVPRDIPMPEIEPDIAHQLEEPSITRWGDNLYVIIPI